MANCDNPRHGNAFEKMIRAFWRKTFNIELLSPFSLSISAGDYNGTHRYDLGDESNKILIECKCHSWTIIGNSPSAKMSVWNEAMYYFYLAPAEYRKILFVKYAVHDKISLGEYYLKRYSHLVPNKVEIWEYNLQQKIAWKLPMK